MVELINGRVLWNDNLLKSIIEGNRCKRKPPVQYIKQVTEDVWSHSYLEVKRKAEWWSAAATNPWIDCCRRECIKKSLTIMILVFVHVRQIFV